MFIDPYKDTYLAPYDMSLNEPLVNGIKIRQLKESVLKSVNKNSVIVIFDCASETIYEGRDGLYTGQQDGNLWTNSFSFRLLSLPADPALLENYISKLFLQDEIHNLEEKHVQVRKAAKDVADEVTKGRTNEDANQSIKNAPGIEEITTKVAEKHGLITQGCCSRVFRESQRSKTFYERIQISVFPDVSKTNPESKHPYS